jgi:hypothetical protein
MTTIEQAPTTTDAPSDWQPIAHLAMKDRDRERPVQGLCGAPLLGIPATGNYETCDECAEIMEQMLCDLK